MPILQSEVVDLFVNENRSMGSYDADGRRDIVNLAALESARREICTWSGYKPTPLHNLASLAARMGVAAVFYKDEAERFGLGSFKALGGAYAVLRLLQVEIGKALGRTPTSAEILGGVHADLCSQLTVACATDGNHGRSVAWGAAQFGCRCEIYVHAGVSPGRIGAMEAFGARVTRIAGNYDESVRKVARDAERLSWFIVSDTSYEGYLDVPRDVMQGYGVMIEEALSVLPKPPSHVFVQGGVGGLAASVLAYLWETNGAERPIFVVVEPERANCLLKSAKAGRPMVDDGPLNTIMAGLACGEVSQLAWHILHPGADAFMAISDDSAAETMRLLAFPTGEDPAIIAGESAVAGLAGAILCTEKPSLAAQLGLEMDSTILVFGTEGATDPLLYEEIVGIAPNAVLPEPATN